MSGLENWIIHANEFALDQSVKRKPARSVGRLIKHLKGANYTFLTTARATHGVVRITVHTSVSK